ncbi:hypothetical protein [Methylophilus aquaticus]|uniref:Uncharacterized protein n=1 Tax=Methylophilus aquaticus TaxID=1971610 RepID=A0ABT9JWE7_9PROT|nr:hypothetical protein [Methylophilus aquaticus]MDP8568909.1 hypothetical protein [Methylophilus aquaticus]
MTYDFTLPPAYTTARLQNLSVSEQTRLLPQVFALARAQYPEWPAEQLANWLAGLAGGNANGTRMAVSLVLDAQGEVAATSAMELYCNGTAMINYSLARKNSDNAGALIYAATKDMVAGIKALQARGETIHFVGKEHHLQSLRAIAGYYAAGQVPIDGPTSLLTRAVKYFEVAYGDPAEVENQSRIAHAFTLADPKAGYSREEDVHLWLLGDFTPSAPNKPLAESLRALAQTYAKEHSIFREKDVRLDPGYRSLHQLADHMPATATYQQAVQASSRGAAQWMGLV